MARIFADLHSHPTFYQFNRLRNHPSEGDPSKFHPWTSVEEDLNDMGKGVRARAYAQADVAKLHRSGTRLVFASICPIEKGFFWGHRDEAGDDRHTFGVELARMVSGAAFLEGGINLLKGDGFAALHSMTKILSNRGPLRVFLQKFFMRYDMKRILYLSSHEYDYWTEFLKEYEFYRSKHGVKVQSNLVWAEDDGVIRSEDFEGCYWVARDLEELRDKLENTDDVVFVMTIEGSYVFTIGPDGRRVSEKEIFERIDILRNLEHPIVFVTLAHHFDNGICGHAHSIPDSARLVMDQDARLHTGFEKEGDLGLRVTRAMLAIDENLEDTGERRILIDCKHMSAQTRSEYYSEIVRPYNAARLRKNQAYQDQNPAIPVFLSHAAYSGVATLDELIANVGKEDDNFHSPPFYAWNINVSDDDVRIVHETGGVIGLVFDSRVCGVAPKQTIPGEFWPDLVMRHIFAMVDVVMLDQRYSDEEKRKVWDCVALGTDYDGLIDPLTRYPTAMSLPRFADDLRAFLTRYRHTRFIENIGVEKLVDKICFSNIEAFTHRNMPSCSR